MDGAAIAAVLAGTAGIITVFIKYITGRDVAQEKRDAIFAKALAANTAAMEAVAIATDKSVKVQVKGFAEAERRNGHLAEISVAGHKGIMDGLAVIKGTLDQSANVLKQNTTAVAQGTQDVAEALLQKDAERVFDEQTVTNQVVTNQTVKNKK